MIYKFRTMYVGAEIRHRAVWATKEDARVTPIGGLMRKLRVDELPPVGLQSRQGGAVVAAHEEGIAHHIGRNNCCQSSVVPRQAPP